MQTQFYFPIKVVIFGKIVLSIRYHGSVLGSGHGSMEDLKFPM